MARLSTHHLLLEQQLRRVKEVVDTRDEVGIVVLKEGLRLMAKHELLRQRKVMIALWTASPSPAEIIEDREVKVK